MDHHHEDGQQRRPGRESKSRYRYRPCSPAAEIRRPSFVIPVGRCRQSRITAGSCGGSFRPPVTAASFSRESVFIAGLNKTPAPVAIAIMDHHHEDGQQRRPGRESREGWEPRDDAAVTALELVGVAPLFRMQGGLGETVYRFLVSQLISLFAVSMPARRRRPREANRLLRETARASQDRDPSSRAPPHAPSQAIDVATTPAAGSYGC
jgi:hypothetical protein